ncbi:OB-fold domain-containing protein [Nocardioides sp.]|uniref:OB-fold domain-containing protein n=1 Tax=Nocardioides sp. TaxID=35761 RepID=UPI0031FEAE06|nr:hypothetical protein [Nocardioides sp.]
MTSLSAPYTVEFPFDRTVGPKVGTFLAGLREARLFGVRAPGGRVLCPAVEFDPETAEETGELVELAGEGTVVSWTWVSTREGDPLPHDFAWALVAIDGTDGSFFHAVDVGGDPGRMSTGMRVRVRWREVRVGEIGDIGCFEPVPV